MHGEGRQHTTPLDLILEGLLKFLATHNQLARQHFSISEGSERGKRYLKFAPLTILADEFRLQQRFLFGCKDASDFLQDFPL